jgi:hypothetical protein
MRVACQIDIPVQRIELLADFGAVAGRAAQRGPVNRCRAGKFCRALKALLTT